MASTNKTTNYELSQYIGTDKPTYLGDYNSDMNKIDAGINQSKVKADSAYDKAETNEINIGELDSLETTLKDSIVDSINEVNGKANKVGNVNNLETSSKTDTVSAINEVYNNLNKFSLTNIRKYENTEMTISGGTYQAGNITVATNSDYSIMKIYGNMRISSNNGAWANNIQIDNVIPPEYRPSAAITINPAGVFLTGNNSSSLSLTINTDGSILILMNKGTNAAGVVTGVIIPFLIFVKNFGDSEE